jgi:DNA transformation protein
MPVSAAYKAFVKDLLSGFRPISIRNMFSGAGIYADGVIFALIFDETLYLKADEPFSRDFAAEGKGPFTYERKGRPPVAMPYWEVPARTTWRWPRSPSEGQRSATAPGCSACTE